MTDQQTKAIVLKRFKAHNKWLWDDFLRSEYPLSMREVDKGRIILTFAIDMDGIMRAIFYAPPQPFNVNDGAPCPTAV